MENLLVTFTFAFMPTSAWASPSPESLQVDEIQFIPHAIFFYAKCHTMIMMQSKTAYVLILISNYKRQVPMITASQT